MTNIQYFGGIEAGGTKFVCAIGKSEYEIIEEIRFPTGNPDETIDQVIDFLNGNYRNIHFQLSV
jgi:fructokinase